MTSPRSVITVGNFDGAHRGHRALIAEARRLADPHTVRVVVLTFPQHPAAVLRPGHAPAPMMDPETRRDALLDAGADEVSWLSPMQEVLRRSPEDFVADVARRFAPVAWVEGEDFRFGQGRRGDVAMLRELGEQHDFEVRVIPPVTVTLRDKSIVTVRSSLVRWLLAMGRVADAQLCLGRPYALRGTVVEGEKLGRQIGFPTANLDTADQHLPADGVYAGTVELDGAPRLAAVSIGTKPALGGTARTVEAHLLDFTGDLYGQRLDLKLLRWLREQWALPTMTTLIEQISRDVQQVRQLAAEDLLDPAATVCSS